MLARRARPAAPRPRVPAVRVDARAEVAAPPGRVAPPRHRGPRASRGRPGGRSVLTVAGSTSDPEAPFAMAARAEEPVVLALGEEPFAMPAGWP